MDEHSFSNILLAPNVEAAHAAGLKHVRERPLHLLPAPALQPLAPVAPDPPAVGIGRLLRVPLALPLPAPPVGLAHVRPQLPLLHARHGRVRVVALVRHHLLRLHSRLRQLPLRLVQRDRQRGRVSPVHRLHRQPDDGSGFHIDRVFELVRQVCPAVLHLRDPRLRIVRMHPVLVRPLVRTLPVQLRQVFPRRRLDPRGPRQLRQPLLVLRPAGAPHNRAQRRVCLQRRRVDPQRLAAQQARRLQPLQHEAEDRRVRLNAQPLPRLRQRGMLRRVLRQSVSQKLAQRKRVRTPPGDAALRAGPLQIPRHQHAEADPGRNTRPPPVARIELAAGLFRKTVESVLAQQSVQAPVERAASRADLARRHKNVVLP